MPRKQAPELKVTLNRKNSKLIREQSPGEYTTPPRLVNKIIEQHFNRVLARR